LRLVSDERGVTGEQPLVSRLRAVIAAKDEQIAVLRVSAIDPIRAAIEGKPWLPPLPAIR